MEGRGLSVPNLGSNVSRPNHSKELGDAVWWCRLSMLAGT